MSISIEGDSFFKSSMSQTEKADTATKLEQRLKSGMVGASEDEMMEACKSFEAYLVEKMIHAMRNTVKSEEEENDYLSAFGDMQYEKYAEQIADSGQLSIAQQLFEAMKRQS